MMVTDHLSETKIIEEKRRRSIRTNEKYIPKIHITFQKIVAIQKFSEEQGYYKTSFRHPIRISTVLNQMITY